MAGEALVKSILGSFDNMRVLIIGDVMLDSYLFGKVERISPEAPVPVVNLLKRENRLGGAANVALNLKALGAVPLLCAVIGDDLRGNELLGLMENHGLDTSGIFRNPDRKTTTKFRVIGNKTQLLRVDEESDHDISAGELVQIKQIIGDHLHMGIDVVVFQDYDKGLIVPDLIRYTVALAEKLKIPVTVDPKRKNFMYYRQVSLFKPNLKELKEGMQRDIDPSDKGFDELVADFMKKQEIRILMVTLSERGIYMARAQNGHVKGTIYPVKVRSISDVSGAGDTVISVASLCMANGIEPGQTARISNIAGSLVCEDVGVVPIDRERFRKRLISDLPE